MAEPVIKERPASAASTTVRTGADKPIVAAERLTKVFKDFWMRAQVRAVDEVTFHIDRGEIFGLLGPNGSGKSTTIKMILGLLHTSGGRLAVFGKRPDNVQIKKRIGYLPEESYLYPFLNARETLVYYGKIFEIDRRTRLKRIDELLDMVGLTAVQYRPVREYSKGMARRIGIAQALINDPELLILDEPTTGLDPIGTRQVKDLILELGRRGKTVLLSSHLLADVEDVVDRMVILYGGKIRRTGTCDELLTAQTETLIETDALDDETISQIDALIRERSGGENAIHRVSKPRQKLEQLFIEMVEEARAAKLATAGATHGGATAAFLKGEAEPSGDELISSLVSASGEEATAPDTQASDAPAEDQPDDNVLDDLMSIYSGNNDASDAAASNESATSAEPSKPDVSDVDTGMIDSLLGDDERENGAKGKGS